MSIQIIRPGLLTSIQDPGRFGLQKDGVVVSGAMDPFALRIANILAGNKEDEAALEITMLGPKLQFLEDSLIAICGGQLTPSIDGRALPEWRPVFIKKGSILSFGKINSGCRAYLAVSGGFHIKKVLGSRSTYLRAGIGGFKGRALKEGDILQVRSPQAAAVQRMEILSRKAGPRSFAVSRWSVSKEILPDYNQDPIVRAIRGGQFDWFTRKSREQFFKEAFLVLPQSDRMGYRLNGPKLSLENPQELLSEAVTSGTVQVPSDGNPIVLMADRQTTGGYPKIAQAVTVDLPVLAQVKPGEKVRFQEIQLEEAQDLLRLREIEIQRLKQGVYLKE